MNRGDVIQDVGTALRTEIISARTPFNDLNYHSGIVPEAQPMQGWGADKSNWGGILESARIRLHAMDDDYKVFEIDEDFVENTLGVPVKNTIIRIVDTIVGGGASA